MELSKRIKLLRILVYAYLIGLSITGLCQIIIGGVLLWEHSIVNGIAVNNLWGPSAIHIAMGCLAQGLCWFGWSSTIKKKTCFLALFNAFLIALLIIQGFNSIWAFKLRNSLSPRSLSFETQIDDSFEHFLKQHFKYEFAHTWNRIQEQFQCCGVDGPSDYRRGASAVPWSCCGNSEEGFITGCTNIYQRGCLGVMLHTIKRHLLYSSLAAFIAAIVQSVGMFCSIQLLLSLRDHNNVDQLDTASMSFRQKLKGEMKPLSARTRTQRNLKIDDTIPETIQNL